MPEISESLSHPLPTKVSMISTTHENKGVSITGSHEVHGKSSTDGTSSTAGKSGSLSLDAIAKAKKALQMQKELSEKLKKITQVSCLYNIKIHPTMLQYLTFSLPLLPNPFPIHFRPLLPLIDCRISLRFSMDSFVVVFGIYS